MAVKPASPSRRRAHTKANTMRTSWQSATPAKPITPRRRPNQNSASPRGRAAPRVGNGGIAVPLPGPAGVTDQNGGWLVFWIYWNTAWSLIISGIMVATIVSHHDAEFVEITAAKQKL